MKKVIVLLIAFSLALALVLPAAADPPNVENTGSYDQYVLPGGYATVLAIRIENPNDTETVRLTDLDIVQTAAAASGTALPVARAFLSSTEGSIGSYSAVCAATPQNMIVGYSIPAGETRILYLTILSAASLGNGDAFTVSVANLSFTVAGVVVPDIAAGPSKSMKVATGFQALTSPYKSGADQFIVVPAYGHPTALYKFGGGLTGGRFVQSQDRPTGSAYRGDISGITLDIIDTLPLAEGTQSIWTGSGMDTSFVTVNGTTAWGNVEPSAFVPNPINIAAADFSEWAVYADNNGNDVWDKDDDKLTSGNGTFVPSDSGWHQLSITFKTDIPAPDENNDSHYLLTFRTSGGWGAGKVGYGDEFTAVIRGVTLATAAVLGDTMIGGDTRSCMVYELVGPVQNVSNLSTSILGIETNRAIDSEATPWRLMDSFFGLPEEDPITGRNDNQYLDYVPDAVLGLNLTMGPVSQWGTTFPDACNQALERITLRFNYNVGGFDVTDLRDRTADKASGICVYRDNPTTSGTSFSGEFDENDVLVPISVAASRWVTVQPTYADLELVLDAGEVPPVTDWSATYNSTLGGASVNNSGLDYFITLLLSQTADADDSFTVTLVSNGMGFTNGASNPTPNVHIVKSDTIVVAVPTQIIDMVQYWPEPGKIVEQSNPQAVLGFNVRDKGSDTAVFLSQINLHVFNPSGTNFTVDELKKLTSDTFSGIAIYKDNDANPLNSNGMFDSGIDLVVPLDGSETWTFSGYQDHYDQHYMTMTVANPLLQAAIPDDDNGVNAGADYFIVIRTSSTASDGHSFYFKLVDPASVIYCDQTGNDYSVTFRDNDPGTTNHETGLPSTANDMWSFTGRTISVVAVTAMAAEKLTTPGQQIDAQSDQVAVLGLNINDGTNGVEKLTSVTVSCTYPTGASGGFSSSDLATLATDYTSGFSLYADDGDSIGVFDANDHIIQIGLPSWNGTRVTLNPTAGVDIPNNDAATYAGNDFFVVLRTSSTINYRDSFVVSLVPGGVTTTSGVSDSEMTVTTDAITCRVPTFYTNLTATGQDIGANDTVTVIGINMRGITSAGVDGGDQLTKITVAFSNIGGDFQFTSSDLSPVNSLSTAAGVAIWADLGATNVGSFDRATDVLVPFAATPVWTSLGDSQFVTIDIVDTAIPAFDTGVDAGYDFYIVISSSNTISYGDNFTVTIPKQGLEALSGKVEKTVSSCIITSNAVTSTVLTDLVGAAGAQVEAHGDTVAVIGINAYDAPTGSEYINQITLRICRVGTDRDFSSSDLADLTSDAHGGIQLYRDDGATDGVFDALDSLVTLDGSQSFLPQGVWSDSYTVTLTPFSTDDVQLPGDNVTAGNVGADYYIVVKTSTTMNFLDDFFVEVLPNGISYSAGPAADSVASGVIACRVPVVISDVATETGSVYKKDESDTFDILGINAWDNSRNAVMKTVKVTFANVTGFNLATDINVELRRDNGTVTGEYDTMDAQLATTKSVNQNVLTLTLAAASDSTVPDTDAGIDLGNDFYVVISTSNSGYWKSNDRFTYGIFPGGLEFDTLGVTYTSEREGNSTNSIIGDITPPGHISTTANETDRTYTSGDTLSFVSKWTDAVSVMAYFTDTTIAGISQGSGSYLFSYVVPTPAIGTGDTYIPLVATDARGNTVTLTSYGVEIDTDGPSYISWSWADATPVYSNGDTITLYAAFNADAGMALFGT
ncbi:MAG TPA: hypothetical protein PKM88_06285, partial [bacterium]|nr:hypothetical protein [bacterium]